MASIVAAWPMVTLGEVLRKSEDWIDIDPEQEYDQVTVRLWGKGVALRGKMLGAEIAAARQLRVHRDQFILSRIDARNGAFGLVPDELDGAVVSNDFPSFELDPRSILPAFLAWMSKTHDFVDLCKRASEGTTNRVRLKEDRFLATEVPLPPLDEQRRIVARIEALAHRIEQARGLRREAIAETEALLGASIDSEISRLYEAGYPETRVGDHEVLITSGPRNFSSRYNHSGVRFYRAQDIAADGCISEDNVIWVEPPDGMNTRAFVRAGDLLIVITGATIGRAAVLSESHPAGLVSQHVGLVRVNPQAIDSRFLHRCILAPSWTGRQVGETKYGQGKPGLNLNNLRELRIPFAPLEEQRRIVAYLDDVQARVDTLKRLQAETAAELDALLPAVLDRAFRGEL